MLALFSSVVDAQGAEAVRALDSRVRIRRKIFLYRAKAPFVVSGKSVHGALEISRDDKIRCHECGLFWKSLGSHIARTHGISGVDYKTKHGLDQGTSLVSETLRVKLIHDSRINYQNGKSAILTHRGRSGVSTTRMQAYERRNSKGLCQAQILHRISGLAYTLGRTPTTSELRRAGLCSGTVFRAFNVSNMAAILSLAGLVPTVDNRRKYNNPLLIELLRDYWVAHHRYPGRSDFNRHLLPSEAVFRRHFGSLRKAFAAAGIPIPAPLRAGSRSTQDEPQSESTNI